MTTPPVEPQGEPLPAEDPPPDPSAELLDKQLQAVQTSAEVALNDLVIATDEAQRMLVEMQTRVQLGQMGAEMIPALQTAIDTAVQVQEDIKTQMSEVQVQQAALAAKEQ